MSVSPLTQIVYTKAQYKFCDIRAINSFIISARASSPKLHVCLIRIGSDLRKLVNVKTPLMS